VWNVDEINAAQVCDRADDHTDEPANAPTHDDLTSPRRKHVLFSLPKGRKTNLASTTSIPEQAHPLFLPSSKAQKAKTA
jgi:hypothetical protein